MNYLTPDVERRDASFGQQPTRWQVSILRGAVDLDDIGDEEARARLVFDDPRSRYSRAFVHRPMVFLDDTTDAGVVISSVSPGSVELRLDPDVASGDTLRFAVLAVGQWEGSE